MLTRLPELHRLKAAFGIGPTGSPPPDWARAAVAAVFRHGQHGTEMLFIERARRADDPWSGHMALPGGRVDPTDEDSHATALRETREEVGLDLSEAERLGQLDDLHGGVRQIVVSAHGYWLEGELPALEPNYEVADALWVPLLELSDPARFVSFDYSGPGGQPQRFPGVAVAGERIVWGLTLRLLEDLFNRLAHPFDVRNMAR